MPSLALSLGWYVQRLLSVELRSDAESSLSRSKLWLRCCVIAFAVLLAAVWTPLPAYARKYSLRDDVLIFAAETEPYDVFCYRHRWDSVNYYLQRGDVQAFQPDERSKMIEQLMRQPRTLVFVKSDRSLRDLLDNLPESLEFLPCSRGAWVTIGWIQARR